MEGPVHLQVAASRIATAIGASATRKAVWAIKQAAAFANVRIVSDFLYPPNYRASTVRDHSTAPDGDRKLEFVPPVEIEEAIMEVLRRSFMIEQDDVIKHALLILGFKRRTKKAKSTMRQTLRSMINRGRVTSKDGILEIPSP